MYKYIYIITALLVTIVAFIILINDYFINETLINGIIQEWKIKTNGGYVKLDKHDNYKGDYYLSIYNLPNYHYHIHIIQDCTEGDLCYMIKKANLHSQIFIIEENKSPSKIVEEMINNYNYFE